MRTLNNENYAPQFGQKRHRLIAIVMYMLRMFPLYFVRQRNTLHPGQGFSN